MHRGFPGGPVAQTPHSQCRRPGVIPGWGTRSCMLQLTVRMPQLRPSAAKINKYLKQNETQLAPGDNVDEA